MTPESLYFLPHDWVPNHPRLPVLLYRDVRSEGDVASAFETLFAGNGWVPRWRDGVYDYHHYHSTAHEVLGCSRGSATLVLGGPGGKEVTVSQGDVVLLPAGTGHRSLAASEDFQMVGAYPDGQAWDICRDAPDAAMRERIATLPFPDTDPVTGSEPPLTRFWPRG